MLFFGHLGITIFLGTLLSLPILFVAVGVLLPDVVDKVFFTLGYLPCGRSLAHNLFFGPVIALVVYALTRKKIPSFATLFGAYLHLIEDMKNFIPWFYPFVNYAFDCKPVAIRIGTFEIVTETIGILLLVAVFVYKDKLINLGKKIKSKLRRNVFA